MNNYELTTDKFCTGYKRYPKRFTWSAFRKFGHIKGQILCEKYNIILTDYETRNERITRNLKKFNMHNFNKGMVKFNKGIDLFTKAVK